MPLFRCKEDEIHRFATKCLTAHASLSGLAFYIDAMSAEWHSPALDMLVIVLETWPSPSTRMEEALFCVHLTEQLENECICPPLRKPWPLSRKSFQVIKTHISQVMKHAEYCALFQKHNIDFILEREELFYPFSIEVD
jgi:hypothetical protein